jgi:hypothetical protein
MFIYFFFNTILKKVITKVIINYAADNLKLYKAPTYKISLLQNKCLEYFGHLIINLSCDQ